MNGFKLRKELTFTFHLYSIDPQYTIPGTIEYGEDIECLSRCRSPLIRACQEVIHSKLQNFTLNKEDSVNSLMLVRLAYESKNETFQYVLNFLIDSKVWPQRDPVLCAERKRLVDSGQLGQNWWIHHIDLPDGSELDVDDIFLVDLNNVKELVRVDASKFIENISKYN